MRTLDEITTAVRRNEPVTVEELTYSVCAYDVLLAQLGLDKDPVRLKQYMIAGDMDPREYVGSANDPNDPSVQDWHRAMEAVPPSGAEIGQEYGHHEFGIGQITSIEPATTNMGLLIPDTKEITITFKYGNTLRFQSQYLDKFTCIK